MSRLGAIVLTLFVAIFLGLYLGSLTLTFAYGGYYLPAIAMMAAWIGVVWLTWRASNKREKNE